MWHHRKVLLDCPSLLDALNDGIPNSSDKETSLMIDNSFYTELAQPVNGMQYLLRGISYIIISTINKSTSTLNRSGIGPSFLSSMNHFVIYIYYLLVELFLISRVY
jgi:hypothetical protein